MAEEVCFEHHPVQPHTEVDMTDDEIQKLLHEAENRLRAPGSKPTQDSRLQMSKGNENEDASSLIPKLSTNHSLQPYVHETNEVAMLDPLRISDSRQKNVPNFDPTKTRTNTSGKKKEKPSAGDDWFNLPKTEMTPELKRDLQLLRMRSVLDPKRHYKKEGKAKPPEFSQVGTIVEGPTEFFNGRIAKKDRKRTFVEEAMALERETRRFESKYNDIQTTKRSGKKAFYKDLRSKRGRKNT
ncbi:Fcf2 domain-containing protein [Aspergillus chevalieri]|uniref:Fcf2 pre-rRNA processing C-terminal domain-containing protein n=1 Tax=Aspergillus chevalieri TaxID=182096 RepID=A0A7R7ZPU3_ASPCH|nr:uncharacterized protein ACHE_50273A [Aspergillus chevalieri]BCR89076.1 hypothetical protein ACHE_50273A [Aspergillus chevalieri]